MSVVREELTNKNFVGEVHDTVKFVEDGEIHLADGTVLTGKAGEEVKLPISYNLIVDSFSKLIATMLKGNTTYINNLYWEVGSGQTSWSDNNPPVPVPTDTKLNNPLARKKINMSDVSYIDANGNVTTSITNRLQMSVVFGTTEANGYLREFGIFAGGNTALGSGLMINRKTHGVIYKTTGIELHRKIHFKF